MIAKEDFTKQLTDCFSIETPNSEDKARYKGLIEDAVKHPHLLENDLLENPLTIENHRLKLFYINCVYGLLLKNNSAFKGFLSLYEATTHPKYFDKRILITLEKVLEDISKGYFGEKTLRMELLTAFWSVVDKSVTRDFENAGIISNKTTELIATIFGYKHCIKSYADYIVFNNFIKNNDKYFVLLLFILIFAL